MGKKADQQLLPHHHQQTTESTIQCHRCFSGYRRHVTPKCAVVLAFGISVLISAVFFLFPLRPARFGFDAKESIKLRSTIQAHFILQKPVRELVNHIATLEYEINKELGVPSAKISILSMHQCSSSNCAHVVFGIRSVPTGAPINRVSLDMLRLSLIEIFLKQYNLLLTPSVFGEPSRFEILKFPGGITVIPEQNASIWQIPPILFSFTVNSSVVKVKKKFPTMKEMLKSGLLLRSYENVYVQITSTNGSTVQPPVTVQVSVISNLGSLSPERLRQLGQIIVGSYSGSNLGLDNSVFGKIKEVSLSSFLKDTLNATPPSPSPAPATAPAPEPNYGYGSPSPELPPVYFVPTTPPQSQVAPTSPVFPKFPSLHVSYVSNWRHKRRKCEGLSPTCDSPSISSSLS